MIFLASGRREAAKTAVKFNLLTCCQPSLSTIVDILNERKPPQLKRCRQPIDCRNKEYFELTGRKIAKLKD